MTTDRKKGRAVTTRPSLLWIGDAVAHTGFATVTHGVLDYLSKSWDVNVLGVNYFGDPHNYKYPIYPASLGGDIYGIKRMPSILKALSPNVVLMLNDPWIVRDYMPVLEKSGAIKAAYVPIDAKNVRSDFLEPLNELDLMIAYTQFGLDEMTKSGLTAKSAVIPHGFDPAVFKPMPRNAARKALGLPQDWFIVGCVNRNQPRKRQDLLIEYFAEWVKDKPENVKLYLHCALHDVGWDLIQLAEFYGVADRLIVTSPNLTTSQGVTREQMAQIYNAFDVQATTTIGEGWGLPTMEAMACRVPQIVPDWSALGEWPRGGVEYVACTSTQVNTGGINTIGGVADKAQFVEALNRMYADDEHRLSVAEAGYNLVSSSKFTWSAVGAAFDVALRGAISNGAHQYLQPLGRR
jgi:D-inositol-3-phosphate glycosyltransferase